MEVNIDISFVMALKSTVANRTGWTFFLPSLFNKLCITKSTSDPVVMLFMSCLHHQNSYEVTITFYNFHVTLSAAFLISLDKHSVFCRSRFFEVVSFLEFRLEEATMRRSIFINPDTVFGQTIITFWVMCGYLVLRQVPGCFHYILHQDGDTRQWKENKCIFISHLERDAQNPSYEASLKHYGKHSQTSVKNVFSPYS